MACGRLRLPGPWRAPSPTSSTHGIGPSARRRKRPWRRPWERSGRRPWRRQRRPPCCASRPRTGRFTPSRSSRSCAGARMGRRRLCFTGSATARFSLSTRSAVSSSKRWGLRAGRRRALIRTAVACSPFGSSRNILPAPRRNTRPSSPRRTACATGSSVVAGGEAPARTAARARPTRLSCETSALAVSCVERRSLGRWSRSIVGTMCRTQRRRTQMCPSFWGPTPPSPRRTCTASALSSWPVACSLGHGC
mmetsp:Transcript_94142/g.209203  ORF Transcript_94142/g.209203 Transcript_94142/m.209203 type:complete len:250 (+) Transcript_94142:90-839(+)